MMREEVLMKQRLHTDTCQMFISHVLYSLFAQFRHLWESLALEPKYARIVARTHLDAASIVRP